LLPPFAFTFLWLRRLVLIPLSRLVYPLLPFIGCGYVRSLRWRDTFGWLLRTRLVVSPLVSLTLVHFAFPGYLLVCCRFDCVWFTTHLHSRFRVTVVCCPHTHSAPVVVTPVSALPSTVCRWFPHVLHLPVAARLRWVPVGLIRPPFLVKRLIVTLLFDFTAFHLTVYVVTPRFTYTFTHIAVPTTPRLRSVAIPDFTRFTTFVALFSGLRSGHLPTHWLRLVWALRFGSAAPRSLPSLILIYPTLVLPLHSLHVRFGCFICYAVCSTGIHGLPVAL